MSALLCALFFLSGTAALLFETLWFRQAGLAFGNGVWASSLVLSSFMAGLALGNGLAARFGGGVARPLRLYAALELAIAAAGVVLVFRLPSLSPLLVPLLQPWLEVPWLLNALRLAIAFVLLLVPATAMGATLPVMVGALRARDPSFGGALGRLYGWNTFGAVLGALAGELFAIERWGVYGTATLAAGCNALAAVGALAVAERFPAVRPAHGPPTRIDGAAWRLLAATFTAGGLLLALEVVWFRFLHLSVHSGSVAFAWMLAVVLAGIAGGGIAGGAWLRRRPEAWRHAPVIALSAGAATAVLYGVFHLTTRPVAALAQSSPLAVGWMAAVLGAPVAALSGVLFPLLGAALARHVSPETRAAGLLTLANTLGCALGSLVGGFVLLPMLGMERALFGVAAAYALVAWAAGSTAVCGGRRAVALAAAAFAGALLLFPFGRMERVYLRAPIARWHAGQDARVLALREGRTETAALVERRLDGQRLSAFLVTDSFSMSSTAVFARRYMKLYVYWPVALRPEPRDALLISYGVGSTASALVATRSLERIDVVDVSRDILALSDHLYAPPAHPLRDPRVHVHVEDGRYYLGMTPRRYDLITGEPPPPKNAGIVNLYTREYFALIHDALRPQGVATYWLPVHNLLESDAKAIIRGFCDVFSDCSLWVGNDLDWMLVGSRGGLAPPGEEGFTRQWRDPALRPELERLGFGRPELLGATFLGDAAWLDALTRGVAPLTDAWPKRLSDRLQDDARPVFGPWMETEAARARFAASPWIARLWPAALRSGTLDAFDLQALANAVVRGEARGWPWRLRALDRALAPPAAPELARWVLGVTADATRATHAALAAGRPRAPHQRTLAIDALAAGAFVDAAQGFAAARQREPGDAGLWLLEAYAHCRAGDPDAARALLDAIAAPAAPGPGLRASVDWLRTRCGRASGG